MKKLSIALLLSFLFFSCEEEPIKPANNAELTAIIQKFVAEGAQRGINFNTEFLEAFILDEFSLPVGAGGFCGYGWWSYPEKSNPRIEILDTGPCWTERSEIEKENLVFHELGHALLQRNHINGTLPNGISPKSIMCGDGTCSNYHTFYANGPLRAYYLDELFDDETVFPNFFVNKQTSSIVLEEDFESYDWEIIPLNDEGNLNEYSVYTDSVISVDDTLYSLAISNQETIAENAGMLVLKRFDLTTTSPCQNLVARANIRTEGLKDASFEMGISFRERDNNGELTRFFFERRKQETFPAINNTFEGFALEIYCVPENADVVTISFVVNASTPATVFIDDVVLELWD